MKLLVTGASGFVGRRVVSVARSRGHQVRAVVRPASADAASALLRDGAELASIDLRDRAALDHHVQGIDGVIHLAALKRGDLHAQLASTVMATENLVSAATRTRIRSFVLLSSFTVYECSQLRPGSVIDERTPTAAAESGRDPYTVSKVLQEEVAARVLEDHPSLSILRGGVVYGPGETWSARLGFKVSDGLWFTVGGAAKVPLVHVEDCARAVVIAAERALPGLEVLNVVGDDQPRQRELVEEVRRHLDPMPRVVRVPRLAMQVVAGTLAATQSRLVPDLRVPTALSTSAIRARYTPYDYPNERIKQRLGWNPEVRLPDGLHRSSGGDQVGEAGPALDPRPYGVQR